MMDCNPIDKNTAIFFRDQLKQARATAFQDAEDFREIVFTIERLGAYLSGGISGLGNYKDCIVSVAAKSPLSEMQSDWHVKFSATYNLVREARNEAFHQGAFARHLTNNAIQLALTLEDALMGNETTVDAFMVRDIVYASKWQPISFIPSIPG